MTHKIDTGDNLPVHQHFYRSSHTESQQQLEEISGMLKNKIIQRSKSAWAAPVVMVAKKDGSIRFCVDYRKLNSLTKRDVYPLPRIDDTLDALGTAKYFSTLDLASGYWQVAMDPQDKEKTAFTTKYGLFEFNVMPFGLTNAPATFQRLMDLVLSGLTWSVCLVYLDDVIIFSTTFEDHLAHLQQVFERLGQAGLTLKASKCHFCKRKSHI